MDTLFAKHDQYLQATPMGFSQIADLPDSYVLADDIEYANGNKLPLWLIGFTY